ncbi:hypothetical protein AHMF7605_18875 [Adhaeribacter arboris]|uniref:Secretion system C-terminal sorting domain-containing protein n=1 Tax=Adhaeribacter arboris TaxID=2072846 RepID=A0A2T2YIU1_9BACT|nr:T9SS type A sorting domain-containing protein [Adhaeribacter arboris]PSR55421.1 hypothetical protein AHMF7605_18875 [Adhaeribacter arboris]
MAKWPTIEKSGYRTGAAFRGGGAALIGRTIHVFGGFSPTTCIDQNKYHLTLDVDKWISSPSSAKWENKSAPMPIPRNHLSTAVLGGKIYAIGGQYRHDCDATEQVFVHSYNPIANTWTRLTNLPAPRSHNEMGTFPVDGKIYVVAGQGSSNAGQNTVLVLTPEGNNGLGSWANATQFKLPNTYFGISSKVVGSKIIISHGALNSSVSNERRETYTANFTRHTPYKFGFVAKCFSKAVNTNTKVVIKNLLYTIEGKKTYSLTSNANWLKVTKRATGTAIPTGVDMEATIDATGLAKGSYSATVTIKGTGTGTTFTSASFCVNVTVGGSTSSQQVVSYTLVNADTNKDIQTISDGATLNLANFSTKNLSIRANTSPSTVGSVKLVLSGTRLHTRTESSPPYALFGENSGDYVGWVPAEGSYSLQATPYSGASGNGASGTSLTLSFKVSNSGSSQPLGALQTSISRKIPVTRSVTQREKQSLNLQVYPNPSSGGVLHVQVNGYSSQETVNILLHDALGRMVQSKTLYLHANGSAQTEIPVQNYKRGYYIISAQGRSGRKQMKVLVE